LVTHCVLFVMMVETFWGKKCARLFFSFCYLMVYYVSLGTFQSVQRSQVPTSNILNHSKWRRIEKDLPKLVHCGPRTLSIK
jgi:hypothetical protein